MQLIKIISEYLLHQFTSENNCNKLVITANEINPQETQSGFRRIREDLQTNHEEADVIIPQQVTHAIESGKTCVKVIGDDTDVFILLV